MNLFKKIAEKTKESASKIGTGVGDGINKGLKLVPSAKQVQAGLIKTNKQICATGIKVAKTVSFVQAYQDRKEAASIRDEAKDKHDSFLEKTENLRTQLNQRILDFGLVRLQSLKETIGVFLAGLKEIDQRNKEKAYEILEAVDIRHERLDELKSLDMSASRLLTTTLASTSVSAVALTGVPTLVTGAVGILAKASTGTAIRTLSGVAAKNATLAWLGGGSLASGGGGMAVGSAVLATTTFVTTGAFAVLTASMIATAHYSKKLTEARDYTKNVDLHCAEQERIWIVIEGISSRVFELENITQDLSHRAKRELEYFIPLIPDFDSRNAYHQATFQRVAILVKSIGELAKAQIIDENGGLNESSDVIISKMRSLLNTQLK